MPPEGKTKRIITESNVDWSYDIKVLYVCVAHEGETRSPNLTCITLLEQAHKPTLQGDGIDVWNSFIPVHKFSCGLEV